MKHIHIKGLTASVNDGNIEKALRKLRKRVMDDGRLEEYREKRYNITDSEKKKVAKKKAANRWKKKLEKENPKNGKVR